MGYALEELEWDNVWWESTGNTEAKRVLYIGDSISCALRRLATEASGMKILFDGYGSSKALDNPYLTPAIQMFGRQEGRRELVLVNNGLHGFHLDDETEYPAGYEKLIGFLEEEYAGTPLAVVLTTSAGGGNNDRVIRRNAHAREIAEKHGLPVIDLYTPSREISRLHTDEYHFCEEGNRILAKKLLEEAEKLI